MPRISMRYRVTGATVEWTAPRGGRVMPKRKVTVTADLVDLSIAGALIQAPTSSAVRVGTRINICLGGADGLVEVRNIRASEEGKAMYGVVFHRMSTELEAAIHDGIARMRNDQRLQSEWNRT